MSMEQEIWEARKHALLEQIWRYGHEDLIYESAKERLIQHEKEKPTMSMRIHSMRDRDMLLKKLDVKRF